MSELVHVQLGGPMAKHFGRHWHLKVRNTKQALDLIEANKPGFKAWMKRNIKTYDRYHIQITNKQGHKWSVDESEYQMMGQSDNIAKSHYTCSARKRWICFWVVSDGSRGRFVGCIGGSDACFSTSRFVTDDGRHITNHIAASH